MTDRRCEKSRNHQSNLETAIGLTLGRVEARTREIGEFICRQISSLAIRYVPVTHRELQRRGIDER
jgi:hypothetical protein